MTLVLPYCNNQVKNLSFELLESKMPCVFDGEPLDFESALMGSEWPTLKDIAAEDDYGPSEAANDDTTSPKTTSDQNERICCKRKSAIKSETSDDDCDDDDDGPTQPKRSCVESGTESECNFHEETDSCDPPSPPQSTTSICDHHQPQQNMQDESVGTADEDDELYLLPRRRVPQMWNSRQKWKDERKKVLKMSVGKLTEIEDPELWLLRSVLINNTIKRLHQDIRNERQAKIKHRQQKIDFYNSEKYEPVSSPALHHHHHHHRLQGHPSPFDESAGHSEDRLHGDDDDMQQQQTPTKLPSDPYDDTSCDEIFGISEDFLRVTIPDRRVSSPIPMNPNVQQEPSDISDAVKQEEYIKNNSTAGDDLPMDVDAPPETPSSSTATVSGSREPRSASTDYLVPSPPDHRHHDAVVSDQRTVATAVTTTTTVSPPSHLNGHQHQIPETGDALNSASSGTVPPASSSLQQHNGIGHQRHLSGSQCATQYRTNSPVVDSDVSGGMATGASDSSGVTSNNAFPPRVPILDSVVYHSLLASLESS